MPPTDDSTNVDDTTPNSDDSDAGDEAVTAASFKALSEDFQKLKADTEGRFSQVGKDFGKVRSRLDRSKGGEPPDPKTPTNGGGEPKGSDSLAVFQLGRLLGSLPDDVGADLETMIADGVDIKTVVDRAEFLKKHLPAETADDNGVTPAKKTPPGRGATPPAITAKVHPDWEEWLQMNKDANEGDKAAAKRLRELQKDPTFQPAQPE